MHAHQPPLRGLRNGLAIAVVCGAVAACANERDRSGPGLASGQAGVFKVSIGAISGGLGPGPHAAWYVERHPAPYVKVGLAVWRSAESDGLKGWFSHLLHPDRRAGEGAAYIDAAERLPTPSVVQVQNLITGSVVTARVSDRTPLHGALISLAPDTAHALGAEPGKPLVVRVRYLQPVLAWNEPPSLSYALLRGKKPVPSAPTTALAAAKAPPPAVMPAPEPTPRVIKVSQPQPVQAPALRPKQIVERPPAPAAPSVKPGGYRIQAGAFAEAANAHRAVAMLAPAGAARIVPVRRGGRLLYRVVLDGPTDKLAARRLRAKVAEIGFADAELIAPL